MVIHCVTFIHSFHFIFEGIITIHLLHPIATPTSLYALFPKFIWDTKPYISWREEGSSEVKA